MADIGTPSSLSSRLSRPSDARAQRSRKALRDALLQLLESRSFEQISIREITQTAGLSYPVFFRQFRGKEDLLADLAREEVRKLLSLAQLPFSHARSGDGLLRMCLQIAEHRSLWTTLLTAGATGEMRSEFARIAAEIGATGPRANPWLPVSLASSFAAAGIFEILAWWLAQPDDVPIANVVKILDALVSRPLTQPQDIQLD